MDTLLRAIAEPRRREILRLVWDAECTAGAIAEHFDVSRPAISQHLRVLREADLVSERREGTRRFYRARPETLEDLRGFLEGFWDTSLAALKGEAEAEERNRMPVDRTFNVTRELRIKASPDTIFEFFTDPEKIARWMGRIVRSDARPGGEYSADLNGRDIAVGTYLEIDRPRRLVFTWGWKDNEFVPPGSSTIEVSLTPEGTETVLLFVHRDLPEGQDTNHATGWDYYLPRLVIAAEGGDPGPDPGPP